MLMGPELDLFVLPEDKRIKVPTGSREKLQQDRRSSPAELPSPTVMDAMCLHPGLLAPAQIGRGSITKRRHSGSTECSL